MRDPRRARLRAWAAAILPRLASACRKPDHADRRDPRRAISRAQFLKTIFLVFATVFTLVYTLDFVELMRRAGDARRRHRRH